MPTKTQRNKINLFSLGRLLRLAPPTVFGRIQLLLVYMINSSLSTKNTNKKNQALGLVHSFLNYREATSTLTPGPKVVVTATLRTY